MQRELQERAIKCRLPCGSCIGYATGVGAGERLAISLVLMPLLVTVVITIIADLDRPRQGLITVGQESMREVRDLMERNR